MSLLAWYPLNGDTKDYSGNNNDLVNTNSTISNIGKIGKCYNFDGSSQYMRSTNTINPFNISICAWVYPITYKWLEGIVSLHDYNGNVNPSNIGLNLTDGYVNSSAGYLNNGRDFNTRPTNIRLNLNTWYHITLTYDYSSKKMSYYINGVLDREYILSYDIRCVPVNIALSLWSVYYTTVDFIFNGNINDVRIYDNVISVKEIKELAKAKVVHYTCNDFQEPTINLFNESQYNLTSYYDHGGTHSRSTSIKLFSSDSLKTVSDPNQDWAGVYFVGLDSILTPGETYTYSFYVYPTVHTDFSYFGYGAPGFTAVVNQWNRVTVTFTATSQSTLYVCLQSSRNRAVSTFYLANLQIEKKPYATPWVGGSRTGIIKDATGYNNNSVLVEPYSPKWTAGKLGSGSYYFDGTLKYINFDTLGATTSLVGFTNCTISFWRKNDTIIQSWLPFMGQDGNYYIMATYNGTDPFYHNYIGSSWQIYKDGVYTPNAAPFTDQLWHHYVIKNVDLSTWTKFALGTYGGIWYNEGYFDDIRLYNTVLSDDDILELYNTRAQLDMSGNLYLNEANTNGYKPTLLNYINWDIGSTGSQPEFYANGEGSENTIIIKKNPVGIDDVVWASLSNDSGSGADGGWNGASVSIDKNKTYRLSVWIRRENIGNGTTYYGCQGDTVWDLGTTNVNNNPYGIVLGGGSFSNYSDEWLLFVFFIHDTSYSGSSSSLSGVYQTNGTRIYSGTDFKWTSSSTQSNLRTYLYYSTTTDERQYWYRPRFEEVTNAPSIQELLTCSEHRTLINESNTYEYQKFNISDSGVGKFNSISEVGITDGLVGYWKLNGDAKDYSGNNNHGTVVGATIVPGLKGLAYNFNGSSDYIVLSNYFNLNIATLTIWFNSSNLAGSIIISKNGGAGNGYIEYHTGMLRYYSTGNTQTVNWGNPTPSVWHCLSLVITGTQHIAYLDGTIVNSPVSSGLALFDGNLNVQIGRYSSGGYYYNGKLSDVRIYNRALSAEEINILYKQCTPLTGMQLTNKGNLYLNGEIKEGL